MTTVTASHPGKAVFQDSAIQIAINDPFDVRTKEAVLPFEPRVINQLEGFEMALYALIVWRILRVVMTVYDFCIAQRPETAIYTGWPAHRNLRHPQNSGNTLPKILIYATQLLP